MQPWITVIVDGQSQHFEQLKLLKFTSAWRQAVDSKFDWEKLWNKWQQFPWTKKAVSRTAALLFDNNNACILKQNTNTARLCRVCVQRLQIWVRHDSPSGWIGPLIREYFYMTQIFSYGTQWANGFVCWLSWEFLFMYILFITFARDRCCWYVTGCTE